MYSFLDFDLFFFEGGSISSINSGAMTKSSSLL